MTETPQPHARKWLPLAIGAVHAVVFFATLLATHFATRADPLAEANQPLWLPLLLAQAACAAMILGLGAGGLGRRLIWFAATAAIVLANFFAATIVAESTTSELVEIKLISANAAQWRTLLVLILLPALCLGGLLQLLRLATGPVTASPQPRESPRRAAMETIVVAALVGAALLWGNSTVDRQEMTALTPSALTTNLTYLATQLIGAAAFAFASGGSWRIVGFTYVVCVAMQGFVNQQTRDFSAFWSAAGPWIVVLATFLALRGAGYLFAASHSEQRAEPTPSAD